MTDEYIVLEATFALAYALCGRYVGSSESDGAKERTCPPLFQMAATHFWNAPLASA